MIALFPHDCTDSESWKNEKWVNWVCVGVTMGTLDLYRVWANGIRSERNTVLILDHEYSCWLVLSLGLSLHVYIGTSSQSLPHLSRAVVS